MYRMLFFKLVSPSLLFSLVVTPLWRWFIAQSVSLSEQFFQFVMWIIFSAIIEFVGIGYRERPAHEFPVFRCFRARTQAQPVLVLVLDRNTVESSRSTSTISLSTSTNHARVLSRTFSIVDCCRELNWVTSPPTGLRKMASPWTLELRTT
jgi:hypothetical protein